MSQRFDELSRAVAEHTTRRTALWDSARWHSAPSVSVGSDRRSRPRTITTTTATSASSSASAITASRARSTSGTATTSATTSAVTRTTSLALTLRPDPVTDRGAVVQTLASDVCLFPSLRTPADSPSSPPYLRRDRGDRTTTARRWILESRARDALLRGVSARPRWRRILQHLRQLERC